MLSGISTGSGTGSQTGSGTGSQTGSGTGSDNIVAATGMVAYAGLLPSPLITQALLDNRSKLVLGAPGLPAATPFAAPGTDSDLPKWDHEVRFLMCVSQFFEGLDFAFSSGTATITHTSGAHKIIVRAPPQITQADVQHVLDEAVNRQDRFSEILAQVAVPISFYASVLNLSPERHKQVFELIDVVLRIGKVCVFRLKHHFNCARPADLSPAVQPMLATPGHGSFPSGHSTETRFLTEILKHVLEQLARTHPSCARAPSVTLTCDLLDKLADRIGRNRVVAGLHFKFDHDEGAKLGDDLAKHFKARVSSTTAPANLLGWLVNRSVQQLKD
ncbi:MAG: hypothetical protein JNK67_27520 [Alphaproteobacteria bacterium]|nr:hypothetical protein [Alphaproteobacteria bacterium]